MAIQPDKNLYPFSSHYMTIEGHHIHYVDEGSGEIILFSHGTPEWSFGYREQVKALSRSFRCIAPDLLGFGLSDKPENADYTVAAHARRMEAFLQQIDPSKIHIVANDFGGAIALSYAIRNPEKIGKVCIFNTWLWPLQNDPHYAGPGKLIKTFIGKFLYLRMNFSVHTIMPKAYGNRKLLTKEIHRHYQMTTANKQSRMPLYAFAKEIMDASPFWNSLWQRVSIIADKPFLVCWGMKDTFIPSYELKKWKSVLKNAQFIEYPEAGHFLQEEVTKEFNEELVRFFNK